MNYGMVLQTKVGILTVIADDENLLEVSFGYSDSDYKSQANPLLIKASAQIAEYLAGSRKTFDLPVKTAGTELQEQVWAALQEVPYGTTVTYKDIIEKLGGDKYRYDFEPALDYELDEYIMSFADLMSAEEPENDGTIIFSPEDEQEGLN